MITIGCAVGGFLLGGLIGIWYGDATSSGDYDFGMLFTMPFGAALGAIVGTIIGVVIS